MSTFPVLLDGYTELPPGKIANVVTFLEMTAPPSTTPKEMPGLTVAHVDQPQPNWYRDLYRRIGEQWLWFSRAIMSDEDLAALLRKPTTHILVARKDGADMGLAELDYSVPGEVEIAMFGVVPEAVGTGIAYILMASALAYAFKEKPRRVWLHTCTFDHPRALGFYRRNGFSPYKFAIEVSDDPRNTGHLPKTAAPQVPLLGDRQ
jgi:GNAT superfamily N-acetyltransferase